MTNVPNVIGLVGNFGAGKSTFARHVALMLGYEVDAFALPLYRQLKALNPFLPRAGGYYLDVVDEVQRRNACEWDRAVDDAKREYPEIREWLQKLGTEAGREVLGDFIWLEQMERRHRHRPTGIVIADVRFPNEIAWVKECGGIIVLVEEPGGYTFTSSGHASEEVDYASAADFRFRNIPGETDLNYVLLQIIAHFVPSRTQRCSTRNTDLPTSHTYLPMNISLAQ